MKIYAVAITYVENIHNGIDIRLSHNIINATSQHEALRIAIMNVFRYV